MLFFEKKEINNELGFTLMEAMVTVSIIAIMSAVYLTSYRSTNQKIILDQAASGIVSDLRLAQNMSMNVKMFNNEIPCGGYGVHVVDASNYVVFADKDNNTGTPACDNDKIYTAVAEKVADHALPTDVKIVIASSIANIAFQPPSPIVSINGDIVASYGDIFLRYGTNINGKKIRINRLTGQISVTDYVF